MFNTIADTRRRFLELCATSILALAFQARPALAAPFSVKLDPKKQSSNVRVKVWVSVNVPGFYLKDHYVGTYYVPYTGTKSVHVNLMAGLFLVFKMSIINQQKDLKFWAEMSAAGHKTTMSIIKKLL